MAGLLTLSVVLPCAFEYAFMERTARSVWEATPAERARPRGTRRWVSLRSDPEQRARWIFRGRGAAAGADVDIPRAGRGAAAG